MNLPQEMGHPRWELAGRETGRGIYHMTWDIQDRDGTSKWELAGRETGRGIYHRRWACVPCVYAQVVHATLFTKYCSILVSIKTVYKFHTCKAHDMCSS